MCAILDTNTFGRFRNEEDENLEPVRKWLRRKNGRIVYSNTKKYKNEWKRGGMEDWIKERGRAGQYRLISEGVQEKENELKGKIKSDDEHIIALALVAKVKILISYSDYESGQTGDRDLFDDFKDKNLVDGRVYTRKAHAQRMLRKDTCP